MELKVPLQTKNKRATIAENTTFIITNPDAFGRFAEHLITAQNFTWRLQSQNLRVHALKFPVANGISFDKTIVLNGSYLSLRPNDPYSLGTGFNSFSGKVVLKDLQLPSDNPAGGINFIATTELTNPRYSLHCTQSCF